MGNYYTFNESVEGYLHIIKKIDCEDASKSYSEENGQFHIVAVADGHGDPACMRSKIGSAIAVKIAEECLREFAEGVISGQTMDGYKSISEQLAMDKHREKPQVLIPLTNTIISRWHSRVNEHCKEEPLTEEDMEQAGRYKDIYERGEKLAHIYGTTLIAALMLPDYLILLQQGDGRCDVFYEDGTVEQPIPWDDRCYENITTSMCDEDAAEGIRSCVIDLKDKKVIACYLGSDGVEDSYRDMEGTHMFYRTLTCELNDREEGDFKKYLKEMLPAFSKQGSGDDISVSGIVDLEGIREHVPFFQEQIERYNLQDELMRYESRKVSMGRKHEILRKRVEEAEAAVEKSKKQLPGAELELENMKEEWRRIEKRLPSVKKDLDKYEKSMRQFVKDLKNFETRELEYKRCRDRYECSELMAYGNDDSMAAYNVAKRKQSIEKKRDELKKKLCDEAKGLLKNMGKSINPFQSSFGKDLPSVLEKWKQAIWDQYKEKLEEYKELCERKENLDKKIKEQKNLINSLNMEEAEEKLKTAETEFGEYDKEYQAVEEKIKEINDQLTDKDNVEMPLDSSLNNRKDGIFSHIGIRKRFSPQQQ